MELLDRYLEAVRRHLPWRRQDDIIAELQANLEEQLEDKEAELGRKLTAAELEAWLKQMGSPLQVAARYQPEQCLIGPALFPIYRYVLRLVLGWGAAIYVIANIVNLVAGGSGPEGFGAAALRLPWVLFVNAAITTLIFAIVERSGARLPDKFTLGAAMGPGWQNAAPPFDARRDGRKKPKTYAQAVAEVIFGWVLLAWLLLVPHYPYLLMGPGAALLAIAPYKLAPVWWGFYWSIVALNAVELTWRIADLLRGRWQGPHTAQHFVKKTMGLIPLVVVLWVPGGVLVALKDSADPKYAAALDQINRNAHLGFEIVALIVLVQLVWDAGRMGVAAYRARMAR